MRNRVPILLFSIIRKNKNSKIDVKVQITKLKTNRE